MKTVTFILALLLVTLVVVAQNPKCKIVERGKRCAITVGLNKDTVCQWHDTARQCGARITNGVKCHRIVPRPGERCSDHQDSVAKQKIVDKRRRP